MDIRNRLQDAPIAVVALVTAVLFAGLTLMMNVASGQTRLDGNAVVSAAIGGLVFGSLMSVVIRFRRRRAGGVTMARSVTDAIRSGTLPPGATTEEWQPLLERRRRQNRRFRWIGPIEFGLFALLGVYLVIATPARGLFWGCVALLFLALAVAYPFWTSREVRRIDALAAQLRPAARGQSAEIPQGHPES